MTPPAFEEAKNHRQRVRAAGLSPDHWYPVEWDRNLEARPGHRRDVLEPVDRRLPREERIAATRSRTAARTGS